jgi:hypothetical protein
MRRLDEGKTSLVDFLRSVSAMRHRSAKRHEDFPQQFAGFNPQTSSPIARAAKTSNKEEQHLVRSAN